MSMRGTGRSARTYHESLFIFHLLEKRDGLQMIFEGLGTKPRDEI
jgi:hypothetical protein